MHCSEWKAGVFLNQVCRLRKFQLALGPLPPASVHAALPLLRQQSQPNAKYCKASIPRRVFSSPPTLEPELKPYLSLQTQKFLEDPLIASSL